MITGLGDQTASKDSLSESLLPRGIHIAAATTVKHLIPRPVELTSKPQMTLCGAEVVRKAVERTGGNEKKMAICCR